MKKAIVGTFAVIGVLAVLAVAAFLAVGVLALGSKPAVPSKVLLEIDFQKGVAETPPDDPFSDILGDKVATVRDVVEGLEKATSDPRVVGLVARVGEGGEMGLGRVQEVRDAVIAFRKKGKPAVAFAETFGEFSAGNRSYYLATAFDPVCLQPSGDIGLTGLMAESMFFRGTLDKLAVVPRMDHRYEYKNAMNVYTEKKYTEPHREATKKVVDSLWGQIVRGIAEARKLPEADVRALADRGPYYGKEALDARLVDTMAYRDEVLAKLEEKHGKGLRRLSIPDYLERGGRPHETGETIALVYGVGAVTRGGSRSSPFGESTMGSDTVAGALRAAIDDSSVKAILFRVDSPGGSYIASDTIWRETMRARKAGKPVIVSMGDVAGSGGYFVAMGADKIVAQPGTITGSIGVLAGKMLTTGLFDKLGISFDEVHTSEASSQWSQLHDYTDQGWKRFQAALDRIYVDFTSKVAEGRKLPKERVLEIAKGRIWSGEDAKELGLVDELGGMTTALKLARKAAKIPDTAEVRLKLFPRERTTFEKLTNRGRDEGELAARTSLAETVRALRPAARALAEAAVSPEDRILAMPLVEVR